MSTRFSLLHSSELLHEALWAVETKDCSTPGLAPGGSSNASRRASLVWCEAISVELENMSLALMPPSQVATHHQSAGSQHGATAATAVIPIISNLLTSGFACCNALTPQGSNVRLRTGDVLEGSGQRAPYPVWEWSPLHSYRVCRRVKSSTKPLAPSFSLLWTISGWQFSNAGSRCVECHRRQST